jgi:nitrite reductase/ring-hydroxylating ferredoxin subunit
MSVAPREPCRAEIAGRRSAGDRLAECPASRRRLLALWVQAVLALVGGGLSALLARAAVPPAPARRVPRWHRAASLADLTPGTPYLAAVSVPRDDGWRRTRAVESVWLLWDGTTGVRALSAACTHLGCRVAWDAADRRFRCPCHGGVYDATGRVAAGPPPRPLEPIEAVIDADGSVLVRLA